jgi:hypothetical protein
MVLAAMMVALSVSAAEARKKKHEEPSPSSQQTPAQPAKPAVPDIATRAKGLLDQDADTVRARFGEPRLLRKEPPAQVWQYGDDGCVLLVILYEPKDGRGAPKVKYAEGRILPGRDAATGSSCLTTPSTAATNASARPSVPGGTVVAPAGPLTGTPVYSPGDPVPPGAVTR